MRTSTILVSALSAIAFAAPAHPKLNLDAALPTDAINDISQYFNMLASKTQEGRQMAGSPVCDLSNAQMPTASPTALPGISSGLILKHVAIGRGTQNYTCDTTDETASPSAVGAVATLFNASCIAATYPDLLNMLPRVALAFNLTESSSYLSNLLPADTKDTLAPGNYMISGHHYFLNTTTPFFNLDTTNGELGEVPCAKAASVSAPADAPTGQQGEKAVAWLKLQAREGATGRLEEVYWFYESP
ncbi:hypothetical protein VP1G_05229 [Cytospora mali]|uniref:Malate dehydrogenase n=1 Tax=Cytospora mali TaxID=578113 RepID=A0A194V251_CYTMA|nr:hypothetical protein VP1G_05229 [Valsa mali var. pyri (nom. inval.)]